jgi:choline dehydrogenase-like flavoprotein
MLRQGVTSLRALAAISYYGSQEGWTVSSYDGPWLGRKQIPVLPGPEAPPIVLGREAAQDISWRAQACVIGSGAGGAAAAARLAAAGVDVVLLEAGGATRAADFNQRELDMLPLLYRDAGLRATADKSIAILQGIGLGGSTLHNTGLVVETPFAILERWRAEHGFPYDDLMWSNYVSEVLSVLHATPVPEERINESNQLLRRGAQLLGWQYRVASHNRTECSGCGYCMLGCAYNRKWNASLTWIPAALRAGARVLCDAVVTRIESRANGYRVNCSLVNADRSARGRNAIVDADVVLLACGALETPALLQKSRLGNRQVGRGLRLHPTPLVYAVFDHDVIGWRGVPQCVLIEEFASFLKDGRGGFLLLPSAATAPGLAAAAAPGLGPAHRLLLEALPRTAIAGVLLHDEGAGAVNSDRAGRPVARYRVSQEDQNSLKRGLRALSELFLAAGARRVHLPFMHAPSAFSTADAERIIESASWAPHSVLLNSVHPQATCAIGKNSQTSASDPHGEVWGHRGLFVADASAFATSVGVPPQVTTMAWGKATAEYALEERIK